LHVIVATRTHVKQDEALYIHLLPVPGMAKHGFSANFNSASLPQTRLLRSALCTLVTSMWNLRCGGLLVIISAVIHGPFQPRAAIIGTWPSIDVCCLPGSVAPLTRGCACCPGIDRLTYGLFCSSVVHNALGVGANAFMRYMLFFAWPRYAKQPLLCLDSFSYPTWLVARLSQRSPAFHVAASTKSSSSSLTCVRGKQHREKIIPERSICPPAWRLQAVVAVGNSRDLHQPRCLPQPLPKKQCSYCALYHALQGLQEVISGHCC
jgi:hypothetical protein